jgi:membrane protease YdiL (CAAX protease family)
MYFLSTLLFLPILLAIYKKFLPTFDYSHERLYIQCTLVAMIGLILGGLFLKTKFWNYMLNGCLISPLLEEIIARFVLYEARNNGFKMYAWISILTALSFGIMHFFYETCVLSDKAAILPKFSKHSVFGLMLCGVFWFFPNLRLLILLHSLSNLWNILATASELQT